MPDTLLAFTFVMLMLLIRDGLQRTASPENLAQLDENLRTFEADFPPEFWVEFRRR
ncbi:hypothetical protein OKW33_007550 [Paraburkholderia atlantica]|uniref:hypothetical protein n=1 Tax=Paraburkholderia atlantica TaxID=2654982 RepID=UPI003D19CB5B